MKILKLLGGEGRTPGEGPCAHCPIGSGLGPAGPSCGAGEALRPEGGDGGAPKVLLVGNPNVGKSVIFGLLTGHYVVVSNYPGTTVSFDRGAVLLPDGERGVLIDTPGVNSLIPTSEDERVTRDLILEDGVQSVIQVADSKNLRRALLLSLELGDLGIPYVLVLNMEDEARSRGIFVDAAALSQELGVEVIPMVAVERKGLARLRSSLSTARAGLAPAPVEDRIEKAAEEVVGLLPENGRPRKAIARMVLADEGEVPRILADHMAAEDLLRIEVLRRELRSSYSDPIASILNRARLKQADRIIESVSSREEKPAEFSFSVKVGDLAVHPIWGIPVLLGILWLIYEFVGVFAAGKLVDLIQNGLFGQYLNPVAIRLADAVLPFPHTHLVEKGVFTRFYTFDGGTALGSGGEILRLVHDFLVGPYGAFTVAITYSVAIILPIVACFFLAFGILEDTGYLPRLAAMVNRIFRLMGLSGKAVLPMVLGLGCDTMATLTARILETRKERILVTLLLALGVPCSAQLGVVLGMLGGLSWKAAVVWAGAVFGVMLLVGAIGARVLPGRRSDFILEVPPVRLPKLANLLVKTGSRVQWYLKEAVPLFVLGTFILFVLDRMKVLGIIEAAGRPLVTGLLHLPQETSQAFLIGFLRRDYGAAGLFTLAQAGKLDPIQTVVSLVTITLFIPCIANLMIIVKERGWKTALGMMLFIFPFAFLSGAVLDRLLRWSGIVL